MPPLHIGIGIGVGFPMGAPAGGAPVGATDDFNRANSEAGFGTASDGHVYTAYTGGGGIASNRAKAVTTPCVEGFDCGLADGTFAIELGVPPATGAEFGGIFARHTTSGNYVEAVVGDTTLYVQKIEFGGATTLGSAAHGGVVATDVVSLVASGSGLSGRLNGVEIASGSSSFNASATIAGPKIYDANTRLDNLSITA